MAEKEFRQDGENSQSGRDGYKSYNREGYNKYGRGEKSNSYGRRPYNNNREGGEGYRSSYNPRFNNGEDRPQRGGYGNRPQRSYGNRSYNNEGGETIMVDVRSVRTLLVSTTTRKEENSVHIVRALTMHNRVENSARIVLVLITMADSRADMVVHREVTVRVLPTTTRMQNIA